MLTLGDIYLCSYLRDVNLGDIYLCSYLRDVNLGDIYMGVDFR